jgi:SAM-dependent methyltransferase
MNLERIFEKFEDRIVEFEYDKKEKYWRWMKIEIDDWNQLKSEIKKEFEKLKKENERLREISRPKERELAEIIVEQNEKIHELKKKIKELKSKNKTGIENIVWILPRPRKHKFKGGFPLHFEKKLLKLLGIDPKKHKILHPFGGMAEYGIRVDIDPSVNPDFVGDAHNLDMFEDNTFDLVICDPPYTDKLSKRLYGTGKICYKKYISEAVRVCKPEGFIASYHWCLTPRPKGTKYFKRIFIGTRVWHRPRVCCIFQKLRKSPSRFVFTVWRMKHCPKCKTYFPFEEDFKKHSCEKRVGER